MTDQLKVLVTGAAGQIAYSLLYSIANGDVFGKNVSVSLILLDIEMMQEALGGVVLELQDCALPNLKKITATCNVQEAFTDIDYAVLVGAMPRRQGMERKDLLKANAKIFKEQGKALENYAKKSVKVLVVGNPANTNCLIAATCAPSISKENFTCLTRLDHNRAKAQIATRLEVATSAVRNVIIWGNHSSTQYPDVRHATVSVGDEAKPVPLVVKDDAWLNGDFITTVQKRGAAIIAARKLSSAMSAAKAICDHLRDWHFVLVIHSITLYITLYIQYCIGLNCGTSWWYILIKMSNFEDVSSQRKSKYGEAFLTAKLEKEKCNLCQPVLKAAGSTVKSCLMEVLAEDQPKCKVRKIGSFFKVKKPSLNDLLSHLNPVDGLTFNQIATSIQAKLVEERLECFGLNLKKDVVATVTDGASIMVKFGKDTSPQHVTCYAHAIHLAVLKPPDVYDFGSDFETVAEDDSEEVAPFLSPSLQDIVRKTVEVVWSSLVKNDDNLLERDQNGVGEALAPVKAAVDALASEEADLIHAALLKKSTSQMTLPQELNTFMAADENEEAECREVKSQLGKVVWSPSVEAEHAFSLENGYTIVDGLEIDDRSRVRMDATANELLEERNEAMKFLSQSD
ncbi:uncharacterized protein LOC143463363 [Clavelina lepadiformis]|uniref:uncharacterized protein LOC143463363 n=1 Tax=Clavelina lepadiformis TaxID=159417 RepID=UPI00404305A6